jgi:hypothetical protein
MEPSELLELSRVNKFFRNTLNQENARLIWKEVFQAAQMIQCPSGFKTFAWANLVAGTENCQVRYLFHFLNHILQSLRIGMWKKAT